MENSFQNQVIATGRDSIGFVIRKGLIAIWERGGSRSFGDGTVN